jgi:hypothetical protein
MQYSRLLPRALFGFLLVLVGGAFALFFGQIPTDGNTLAMDWKGPLWTSLRDGLPYDALGHLVNPPWSVIWLLPLGQLSMQAGWGILAFITLLVLLVSVPRTRSKPIFTLSAVALVMSFPSIRNIVDGNFEALIIAGVLLLLYGYEREKPLLLAVGFLLATTKPQTTLLLVAAAVLFLLLAKPPRLWLKAAGLALIVVVPTMLWRGEAWFTLMFGIREPGSIMDMSLMAALNRADLFPAAVNWALWGAVLLATGAVVWFSQRSLSREKAGLLIAASLLIAPYSASTLTLIAVGVVPYFQKRQLWGDVLLILAFIQIFMNTPAAIPYYAYYSTGYLLLTWATLLWHVWRSEVRAPIPGEAEVPLAADGAYSG